VRDSAAESWLATISILMACMRLDRSNAGLLRVVADVAQLFSATVIGVAASQPSMHSTIMGAGPGEPNNRDLDRHRERAAALEAEFRSALSMVETLHWRSQVTAGPLSRHFANEARGADLIVAAREPGEGVFLPSHDVELSDLLMGAGRPVLIAPPDAAGLKLTRTLVCWKDSREARRAVADALPLLKASKRVDVVELVREHEREAAQRRLAEVGDWLARHGVEASCLALPLNGTEAAGLAEIARDFGVDLIVAGAFGHSRLREWAFGGVTRDLLLQVERCALGSH
jgi:nucleotide-binding universal stress UspA family protein